MRLLVHKVAAWSGAVAVFFIFVGMIIASLVPIPGPSDTAEQTARFFIENRMAMRFGLILAMAASGLLVVYAACLAMHMRKIEGEFSILAYCQLGAGALLALEFIYLIFFWQTATFRVDRSPELIQLLNDMAWIPFVGLSSTLILQALVFGIAVLMDDSQLPAFPRWLGFFSLFAGFMFLPGSFNVFFMDGPFAWNGLIAIYIPGTLYIVWTCINCHFMAKNVNTFAT